MPPRSRLKLVVRETCDGDVLQRMMFDTVVIYTGDTKNEQMFDFIS